MLGSWPWLWLSHTACGPGGAVLTDAGTDVPTDGVVDTDTDTDTVPDTSTPVQTADTGTPPTGDNRLFDEEHVLVVPDGEGLKLLDRDGNLALSRTWTELVGNCDRCGGEGASADDDGLLLAFTIDAFQGGIARIDAAGVLDFRVDGFVFPHDAVRYPVDGTIIVPETTANKLTWISGDGSSNNPIRTLNGSHPDWEEDLPNGLFRLDHEGRTLLLSSDRGGGFGGPSGRIVMWDLTDPSDMRVLWKFPEDGDLDTPHGCMFREYDGRWWMLYAHTLGAPGNAGSVGLAVSEDPTELPRYVADLVPQDPIAPFGFLRGVELTADGELYLTDSGALGPGGNGRGRVIRAPMPDLVPSGESGAVGRGQVFLDLDGAELFRDGLDSPFEGWLWKRPTAP